MGSTPSPDNPPLVVRPNDTFDCQGCGQRLTFDANGFVPPAQLEACRGLCDWSPVALAGERQPDTPSTDVRP